MPVDIHVCFIENLPATYDHISFYICQPDATTYKLNDCTVFKEAFSQSALNPSLKSFTEVFQGKRFFFFFFSNWIEDNLVACQKRSLNGMRHLNGMSEFSTEVPFVLSENFKLRFK